MLCKKMVESKGTAYPCGQCLFCLINLKRDWLSRMILEASCHKQNSFLTLTYDPEFLPDVLPLGGLLFDALTPDTVAVAQQSGTLFPPDLTLFFKRVRKFLGDDPYGTGTQFRYFAVGEYGERAGRPHYHVLAFGQSFNHSDLARLWGHGGVHIGEVEHASIEYCIAYALKYRRKNRDLVALRRHPEFSVMSSSPGLGAFAIGEIRRAILASPPLPDATYLIPDTYRMMGKQFPLPRFIRRSLEDEGFVSARDASNVAQALHDSETLQAVLSRSEIALRSLQDLMNPVALETRQQRILNSESRLSLRKKNETL